MARLLACPATIWILDEPTNHLDAEGKRLLRGLIKTKLENQGVVLLATHEESFFDIGARLEMGDFN